MNKAASSPDKFGDKFDYRGFPAQIAERLRRYADEIATLKRRTVEMAGEIGRVLKDAQTEMEHGTFLQWVEGPAGLSRSAAYRLMDLVDAFGDELPVLGNLPVTTVQLLAAKSVPIELRASILHRAKAGEMLRSKAILKEIEEAKKPRRVQPQGTQGAESFEHQASERDVDGIDTASSTDGANISFNRQSEAKLTHSALNLIDAIGADYLGQLLSLHGMESRRVFYRACEIIDACKNEAGLLVDVSSDDFDRNDGSLDSLAGNSWADQAALDIAERIKAGEYTDPITVVKINNEKNIIIRGDKTFRAFADLLGQSTVPGRVIDICELENIFSD